MAREISFWSGRYTYNQFLSEIAKEEDIPNHAPLDLLLGLVSEPAQRAE